MKKYKPSEQKNRLEIAIRKALIIAHSEKNLLDKKFAEENFRYIVITEISKVKCFGSFPNNQEANNHLCFEQQYHYHGFQESDDHCKFIPDIVSLAPGYKEAKENFTNPLVIELKSNGKITAKNSKSQNSVDSDLRNRIKTLGSCIDSDLLKTRIYLEKIYDQYTFEFGVVLNIGYPDDNLDEHIIGLERILQKHQSELKEIPNKDSYKSLLFGWFNPYLDKPEIYWLNQKDKIKLAVSSEPKTQKSYKLINTIFLPFFSLFVSAKKLWQNNRTK